MMGCISRHHALLLIGGLVPSAAVTCAALLAVAAVPRTADAAPQRLVLYYVAEHEQFISNYDDKRRGDTDNPFGGRNSKAAGTTDNANEGPFPGDETVFTFRVYRDIDLRARAGSATFTCLYYFNKNALCHATLNLKNNGTLIMAGTIDFKSPKFALAVTGGYGEYDNATGDARSTPSAKRGQRLTFLLG